MHVFSRKWTALFLLFSAIAGAYSLAARLEPVLTPLQKLEAIIAPYDLLVQTHTGAPQQPSDAAESSIRVYASWSQIQLRDNGWSANGITAWNVSLNGWTTRELRWALLRVLNESPASAEELLQHSDSRIQYLLHMVLTEWGYGKAFAAGLDRDNNEVYEELKPHALDALLTLARRDDPLSIGTAIKAMTLRGAFSVDLFVAGMSHNSTEIRELTLRWMQPDQQQLMGADRQIVAATLIAHLTDRD
ncbi:MAG: hypothetical protein KDB23_33525, partial [Planctomycetales bacterium]|nr:hypothetical protein [Planctomycetales bacterium]